MTCYERLRKKIDAVDKERSYFKRLENYFRAINDDDTDEYHKDRGR